MTVVMDPATTYAVVVGLERYDAGWSLDGAARDALRAADWLCAAGVPGAQIFLLIDALPGNQDGVTRRAAELGLRLRGGARDEIINVFTKELTALDPAAASHLVVFWSGHGVLDEKHHRALFTADANGRDKRTVRVEDLLIFLQDKEIHGLHDQVVIVDACANFVEDMKNTTTLTHATFPRSRGKHGVRQFVLYAAAQGQIAGQNQAEKYGAFADAVLTVLHPAGGPQWPPDMPGLSASVAAHFEQLRADGMSRQTPVYLSRNVNWNGSEEQSGYGGTPVSGETQRVASEAGITASQLRRLTESFSKSPFQVAAETVVDRVRHGTLDGLFAELAGMADSDEELLVVEQIRRLWGLQQRVAEPVNRFQGVSLGALRCYFDVVPDRQLAPQLGDLDEVLEYLAEFGEPDESAPLLRFVARLELITDIQLDREWFGLSPLRLQALRAAQRQAMTGVNACHLVLDVQSQGAEWPTQVVGRLRTADGQWSNRPVDCAATERGARDAVNRLITWAHSRLAPHSTLSLGFLVSRARFDDMPESWTYVDEMSGELQLGEEYPVVLHSSDRIRAPRSRHRWLANALRIAGQLEQGAPEILWIETPLDPKEITKAVLATRAACVVFSEVPGPLLGELSVDPLIAAINPGAPYIIWLNEAPADWTPARELITALVRNGEFDDVPARTLRIRQQGLADLPCRAIRVLWDKQELLPNLGQLTGIDVRTA